MRKLIFVAFALILVGAGCATQTTSSSDTTTSPSSPIKPQTPGKKLDLSQPGIVCALLPKEEVQTLTGINITETKSTTTDCGYNAQRQLDLPVIVLKADQTLEWEAGDFDYDKESARESGVPMAEISNLGEEALYWDISSTYSKDTDPNIRWIKNKTRFTIITYGLADYGFDTEQKRKDILVKLAKIVDKNW